MIITKDDIELSMRYEGMAKAVFKCERYGDPWEYANAGTFDQELVPQPTNRCKEMILTVIDIAIWGNQNNEETINELLPFKGRVWQMETQEQAWDLIDELIVVLEKIGY